MEKTGCKIMCGAPTTLAVKELVMVVVDNTGEDYRNNAYSFVSPVRIAGIMHMYVCHK